MRTRTYSFGPGVGVFDWYYPITTPMNFVSQGITLKYNILHNVNPVKNTDAWYPSPYLYYIYRRAHLILIY
jgi:hypothetical protein